MSAIEIRDVTKQFDKVVAVNRPHVVGTDRLDLRLHRAQRVRQDDDDPHDHEHPGARLGTNPGPRAIERLAGARPGGVPARRARPLQAHDRAPGAAVLRAAQRPIARPARPDDQDVARSAAALRLGGQARAGALEGHVTESAVHLDDRLRAEAADPRRAVFRPRSGERRRAARRGARSPAPGRDGRLLDARHVRGRDALRSHLHDLQGQQGPRRIARRDPVALRPGHRPRADGHGRRGACRDGGRRQLHRHRELSGREAQGRRAGVSARALAEDARAPLRAEAAVAARHLRPHRAADG